MHSDLGKFLFQNGFRYRKNDKRYPGSPDIVLPKYKTVIFVNRCFWHRHENCKYAYVPKSNIEFWNRKFAHNIQHDAEVFRELKESGWKVEIIWECEIKSKAKRVKRLEAIKETLLNAK